MTDVRGQRDLWLCSVMSDADTDMYTKGYCPLYSCPVWCPCQGGQLPHDGKAGGKENRMYSFRQGIYWGHDKKYKMNLAQHVVYNPNINWSSIRSTWNSHRERHPREIYQIWSQFSSLCLWHCKPISVLHQWFEKRMDLSFSDIFHWQSLEDFKRWMDPFIKFKRNVWWCSASPAPTKERRGSRLMTCRVHLCRLLICKLWSPSLRLCDKRLANTNHYRGERAWKTTSSLH